MVLRSLSANVPERPEKYDVVLGGENPSSNPPLDGAVLGTFSGRYGNLQALLQRQQWQSADLETQAIMLDICQRKSYGFLRIEDLENIDRSSWRSIDNLWRTYSNDRFGLSVQSKIWRSVGGTSAPDWHVWCSFGSRTGWYVNDRWLYWNETQFNLDAPSGHLPRHGAWMGWGLGDFWVGCRMLSAITNQLENCEIV
jgi:hypothetical protein